MKIVFMGTPEPAVPTLEALIEAGHDVVEVWTQPDRPKGRGNRLSAPPVKESAIRHGIPVYQPERVRLKEARARFKNTEADLAVVVAYGQILTRTYLDSFRYGCMNVHFSLLPKYRGAAPVNWAIANGEEKTGVTTMKMDRGLDTGDILLVDEVGIGTDETAPELMERLAGIGAELAVRTVAKIGDITPKPQNNEAATYAPLFAKSDGLIEWSSGAQTLSNRVRGFQPFPGSFSFLNGIRRTIFWKISVRTESTGNDPGVVIGFEDGRPLISCGEGSIVVEEAQLAGKPRQSAEAFSETASLKVGDYFGAES